MLLKSRLVIEVVCKALIDAEPAVHAFLTLLRVVVRLLKGVLESKLPRVPSDKLLSGWRAEVGEPSGCLSGKDERKELQEILVGNARVREDRVHLLDPLVDIFFVSGSELGQF
jgi:hypothetical protein